MAVLVLAAGPGSPGVTTTALGMALTWPHDVLLADCDREPSQSVQAGYLRGMDHGGRGLAAIARLHREDRDIGADLLRHTVPLTADDTPRRRYLPGLAQPASVRLFDLVWADLADALAGLAGRGTDVIVDAGRIGRDGLPMDLLARADAVGIVTRTSLRGLAATRLYAPIVADQLRQLPTERQLGLVLVGANRPYSSGEISAQFGLPCWAELEWSPTLAAVLSDGADEPRRFTSRSLMNQFRALGLRVAERIEHQQADERALVRGRPNA